MLYPKMNSCRDVYNLNGVWNYAFVEEQIRRKKVCR